MLKVTANLTISDNGVESPKLKSETENWPKPSYPQFSKPKADPKSKSRGPNVLYCI
jgi:hypothetical protein